MILFGLLLLAQASYYTTWCGYDLVRVYNDCRTVAEWAGAIPTPVTGYQDPRTPAHNVVCQCPPTPVRRGEKPLAKDSGM